MYVLLCLQTVIIVIKPDGKRLKDTTERSNFVSLRVVPVRTAGCYVPGGLYGYTVSAVMTAGVARAAGVTNIIVMSSDQHIKR